MAAGRAFSVDATGLAFPLELVAELLDAVPKAGLSELHTVRLVSQLRTLRRELVDVVAQRQADAVRAALLGDDDDARPEGEAEGAPVQGFDADAYARPRSIRGGGRR